MKQWNWADPLDDFHRHDAEQEEELNSLPRCSRCGEPIQQEMAVFLDGEWICDDCLNGARKWIVA